jgi:hypothetical protein
METMIAGACSRCGKRIVPGAKYCVRCGMAVMPAAPRVRFDVKLKSPPVPRRRSGVGFSIIGWIIAIFCITRFGHWYHAPYANWPFHPSTPVSNPPPIHWNGPAQYGKGR